MTRSRPVARIRFVAALLSVTLVSACGTELSRQAIMEAQRGGLAARGESAGAGSGSASDLAAPAAGSTGESAPVGPDGAVPSSGGTASSPSGTIAGGPASGGTTGATTKGGPSAATGGSAASGAGAGNAGAGQTRPAGSGGAAAKTTQPGATEPAQPGAGTTGGAPIVLGNVGNYSGPLSIGTVSVPKALQVWARSVNDRGGIAGHPVKVLSADDGGDPSRSLSVVKSMVENEKVIAFVANMTILTLSSSLKYLEEKRIPTIGGDTTNTLWNQSPMLFPEATSINELLKAIARTAGADGFKKFGLLYCIEADVCRNVNKVLWDDDWATKVGVEKTFNAQVSITQPDFTSECIQMQSRGVQSVFAATDGNTAIRIAQSCARQGFRPHYYTGSLVVIESQAQVKELDGMRAPVGTFPWMVKTGAAAEYSAAIEKYAPGLSHSQGTSAAWVSGKVVEKAAANVGAVPTSDEILRGLWAIKNDTIGGLAPPLTFVENQPTPEASCYFFVEIAGGSWTSKKGLAQTCP